MAAKSPELEALKQQIVSMTPADRLRFAAAVLENADAGPSLHRIGHAVAERVVTEWGATLALHALRGGK